MKKLISFFIENLRIVNVIVVAIFIVGCIAGLSLRKELYPNTSFNSVRILTNYSAGSVRDTELLVTKPIEDELKGTDGIEKMNSFTTAGRSVIYVSLNVFDETEKYGIIQDIQQKVSMAQKSFPQGAESPEVTEIKTADFVSVIYYQLKSKVLSELQMHEIAKEFKDNLQDIPGVSNVDLSGDRDREVQITFDSKKMLEKNVSITDLTTAISNYVVRQSAGFLYSPGNNRSISILTDFDKVEQINNINVRRNFENIGVSVSDLATVHDTLQDKDFDIRGNLLPGITLTVYKDENADAFKVVKATNKAVERFEQVMRERYSNVPENVKKKLEQIDDNPIFLLNGANIKKYITDLYGYKLTISPFEDTTKETKKLLTTTFNNASLGVVLAFIVLFIFLDFSISFWTSLTMPIALAIVFIILFLANYSFNNMVLFGIVIVLGVLVNNGIVVTENIYRLRSLGVEAKDAALNGTTQIIVPIIATTLCALFAFMPLILVDKIDFIFIRQMPLTVVISLVVSLISVFCILPSHIAYSRGVRHYNEVHKKRDGKTRGDKIFARLISWYSKNLNRVLRFRYWVLTFFIVLFSLSLLLIPKIKFVLYYNKENKEINIYLKAPEGTNLDEMSKRVYKFENLVVSSLGGIGNPLESIFTTIGGYALAPTSDSSQSSNQARLTLYLVPYADRKLSASEIVINLKKNLTDSAPFYNWLLVPYINKEEDVKEFLKTPTYARFIKLYAFYNQFKNPNSNITFGYKGWQDEYKNRPLKVTNVDPYYTFRDEMKDWMDMDLGFTETQIRESDFGPRKSRPIEVVVAGDNDDSRDKAIIELHNYLESIPGVFSIQERKSGISKEIYLNLDIPQMDQLGINASNIATAVKSAFVGTQVGTIFGNEESVPIDVMLSRADRSYMDSINDIPISTKYNKVVNLGKVVHLELHQDLMHVVRDDDRRVSGITADVDTSITDVKTVASIVDSTIPKILVKYPGITITQKGQVKDQSEVNGYIRSIILVSLLGIFFTLLISFRSLIQPFLVLLVIPFSLIGVIWAFYIHNEPFGFFGIIGIIGLFGMVINDSIIMIYHINRVSNSENHKTLIESVKKGAIDRVRPIFLVVLTSCATLFPIIYSWGGSVSVLRPLALTIAYGIIFGTFITLFLIPSLCVIDDDISRFFSYIFHKISTFKKNLFKKKDKL